MARKIVRGDSGIPIVDKTRNYENENALEDKAMKAFEGKGFLDGDELSLELDGIEKKGVVSSIFYIKSNKNSPGPADYCMTIDVTDPNSTSEEILRLECSLEDIASDTYKIVNISERERN